MNFQIQAYEDTACGTGLRKKGIKVANRNTNTGVLADISDDIFCCIV
jgi:hypothetical protein